MNGDNSVSRSSGQRVLQGAFLSQNYLNWSELLQRLAECAWPMLLPDFWNHHYLLVYFMELNFSWRILRNWRRGMLECDTVWLVRADASEERMASITDSLHTDDGGDTFLRNVGYYKSHTVSHPRRRILHSHRRKNLKSYLVFLGNKNA
jgi:hypothetical protein